MPMLTDNSCSATIEDSTPVCSKFLKKALSPPVTIRNFFKPSSKKNDPKVCIKKAECSKDSSSVGINDESVVVEDSQAFTCGSEPCSSSGSSNNTTSLYFIKTQLDKGNNSLKSGTKLKRAAESSLTRKNSAKRCKKQGNILNSIQNSSQRRECPICNITFSPTANNKEINDHMDSCLIE